MPRIFLTRLYSLSQRVRRHPLAQHGLRRALVVGLLLTLALPSLLNRAVAAPGQSATLRCRLEQTTISADEQTVFILEVLDVSDLYGYELDLKFNAARVHFVDADAAKAGVNLAIGDFLSPDFVVVNSADNDTGTVQLALTQLSPSAAVSGAGELARATLAGVSAGLVNFALSDAVLSDPAGKAIPVELQNCSLEVTGGEATPPTATPTPTPTPTVSGTPATPTPTPTSTPDNGSGTGSISGSVFLDDNEDGVRNPLESGIYAFVIIYRLGTDQQWADLTDDDGNYAFTNLPTGRYFVEMHVLDGGSYRFTTSATYNLQIVVGSSPIVDFGLQKALHIYYYFPLFLMGREPSSSRFEPDYRLYLPFAVDKPAEK